jgi:alpha/beta superfamily hydrolase
MQTRAARAGVIGFDEFSREAIIMDLTGNMFFEGPAGRIEAILKEPAGEVTRAAIVCHPHPLFGGTMHNKVVYRIARAFQEAGFAVLRFNFRGAGRSHGAHDQGRGEQDDLRAATRFLEERYPQAEIWLAGFSFGSAVMLRAACEDSRIRALAAVGVPVSRYDFSQIQTCAQAKLFVQGSKDEFGAVADLERFVAALSEPKRLKVIDGADHFFEGKLDELSKAVSEFIKDFGQPPDQ